MMKYIGRGLEISVHGAPENFNLGATNRNIKLVFAHSRIINVRENCGSLTGSPDGCRESWSGGRNMWVDLK